jgi:hypothetical protein
MLAGLMVCLVEGAGMWGAWGADAQAASAQGALSPTSAQSAPAPSTSAPSTPAVSTPAPPTAIVVGGDVRTPLTLSAEDLKALPRTRVEVTDEDGRQVTYEGVLIAELLSRAGAPLGRELRGNAMTTYVLAGATDGYQVVFSLAELDPAMTDNQVILADTVDGTPLFAYQGPWRIVAPKDHRPARSIRMVERIDVVRLKK